MCGGTGPTAGRWEPDAGCCRADGMGFPRKLALPCDPGFHLLAGAHMYEKQTQGDIYPPMLRQHDPREPRGGSHAVSVCGWADRQTAVYTETRRSFIPRRHPDARYSVMNLEGAVCSGKSRHKTSAAWVHLHEIPESSNPQTHGISGCAKL